MRLRVLEEAAAPADGVHELECPCVYTRMLAVRVPPVGGDTLFCCGYTMWDGLTSEQKLDLGQRHVVYTFA